jgi:hypothetical protein
MWTENKTGGRGGGGGGGGGAHPSRKAWHYDSPADLTMSMIRILVIDMVMVIVRITIN